MGIAIWVLFCLFGAVCALYVSVVGFTLSALAAVALLASLNGLWRGSLTLEMLAGAFVALQLGYIATLVGSVVVAHLWRLLVKNPRRLERDLTIRHD